MNQQIAPGGMYRLPQVLRAIPMCRATVYLKIKRGEFPAAVKISERIAVWRGEDLLAWLNSKIGGVA
mgnify:CR=1 FL=1